MHTPRQTNVHGRRTPARPSLSDAPEAAQMRGDRRRTGLVAVGARDAFAFGEVAQHLVEPVGVVLAAQKVRGLKGLTVGLDKLLEF